MIVNYDKAVEYLVEAYRNSLQDDGDFLADELNDDIGGGGISVVTYNEETDQLEVDDDQYIPKQLTCHRYLYHVECKICLSARCVIGHDGLFVKESDTDECSS